MANKEKIETEKAELKDLTETIGNNLYFYHPTHPLPHRPFFLQYPSHATPLLTSLLEDSDRNHKAFAKFSAREVLKLKELDYEFNLTRASNLKESLEIDETMQKVLKMDITTTSLFLKVNKSQSTKGPVTVKLSLPNREKSLEEGDDFKTDVKITDSLNIDLIVNENGSDLKIDSLNIALQKITEETYYMKAAENKELASFIQKKTAEFEVKIAAILQMSVQDRVRVLSKRNLEVDNLVSENDKNVAIYRDILSSLQLKFDDDEQAFKSTVYKRKVRESCCEHCLML